MIGRRPWRRRPRTTRPSTSAEPPCVSDLYDSHGATVYGLALCITERPELAEAVCVEVFNSWSPPIDADESSIRFGPSLYSMARRLSIQASQTRSVARDAPVPDRALWPPSTLSGAEREVLDLACFGGRSQRQISEVTGYSMATVAALVRHGLARLDPEITPDVGRASH